MGKTVQAAETPRRNRLLCAAAFLISLISLLSPAASAHAAGKATVAATSQYPSVNVGQQFSVYVNVTPNNAIAGAQFTLSFNPSLVTANNVTEGGLLKQGGATTYFSPGLIDNQGGRVSGVVSAITSPGQTVTGAGTLAVIAMTARSAQGTSGFILTNVVVGDVTGKSILSEVVAGQIAVTGVTPPPVPPRITQSPVTVSSGRDALGVSGGVPAGPGITNLIMYTDGAGLFNLPAEARSDDGKAKLKISKGVLATAKDGAPLNSLSINPMAETPVSPANTQAFGLAYTFGPNGANFKPAIVLTLALDRASLPGDLSLKNLRIGQWNGTTWDVQSCSVDEVSMTVSANISHFSNYGIIYLTPPAPDPPPTVAPEQSTRPTSGGPATGQVKEAPNNPPETEIAAAGTGVASAQFETLKTSPQADTDTGPSDPAPVARLSILAMAIAVALVLIVLTGAFVLARRRNLLRVATQQLPQVSLSGIGKRVALPTVNAQPRLAARQNSVDLSTAPRMVVEKSVGTGQMKPDSFVASVVRELKPQSETEEQVFDLIVSRLSLLRKISPQAVPVEPAEIPFNSAA